MREHELNGFLWTNGIARIDEITSKGEKAIVSVRGKQRYVMLTVERYHYFSECELEAAILGTNRARHRGDAIQESVVPEILYTQSYVCWAQRFAKGPQTT